MNKRLVAEVNAHHNVDDFRPYKIRFADKGSKKANLVHMIVAAINKEADWNGWFCEIEFITPKQLKDFVTDLVERSSKEGTLIQSALTCRDEEVKKFYGDDMTIGLIAFADVKDKNFGFLFHYADSGTITDEEFAKYGDKYETKWVSLI